MSPASVSVIVPAYNEAQALEAAVRGLARALAAATPRWEVLVVESGSTDGTREAADRLAALVPGVRAVHQAHREGYGSAVRLGVGLARMDHVSVCPVDVCFPLETYAWALPLLDRYEAVLSYRSQDPRGWWRRFMSGVFNVLARSLLGVGVRHVNSAFKLLPRGRVLAWDLATSGWCIDAEVLVHMAREGVRHVEVPVPLVDRVQGRSTVTAGGVLSALVEMLRIRRAVGRCPRGARPEVAGAS
ncbi:MAG: glycosyltransferase family 2 protein [Planctomycetes bacterium]|nr:glycosyltransferase family 2 protein [Planctomycetota bacterium]